VATVAQVLNRASRQLLSGTVEERNRLAVAVNSSATTLVLSYDLGGVRSGAVIELGSEQMYVWDVNEANKNVTVERAFNGTTAASHLINTVITVNPRFPRAMLLEALNDELADLSSPVQVYFLYAHSTSHTTGQTVKSTCPQYQT